MVQPTGADDADTKLFSNLEWFLVCDDAVDFNSPAASTTEPLGARLENRTMNRLTTRHKRKNCHRTNGTFGFAR